MVHTCKDCVQIFLTRSEFNNHVQTHYQTHLDKCSNKDKAAKEKAHDGLNRDLYKVFERYNLGLVDKAMLCLWRNGDLDTAIRGAFPHIGIAR
jgi:hypothetical protein